MGAHENKFPKMTSYTQKFQNFISVFTFRVKYDMYFLRLPWEIVFGVITDTHYLYQSYSLEKCKKECDSV